MAHVSGYSQHMLYGRSRPIRAMFSDRSCGSHWVLVSTHGEIRGDASLYPYILGWYETGEIDVCFRNHSRAGWDDLSSGFSE